MLAIVCASRPAVHFKSSAGRSSCLLVRPLFSLPIDRLTSLTVIGFTTRDCLLANAGSYSMAGSLNRRMKCSVIRVFSNASGGVLDPQLSE